MRVAKAMVVTALMVVAGVAHAGDSAKMVLDLRTGPRASGGDETLAFSSLWDGGADATVTIAQDGVAIAENLAGEGERAWSVPYNGTYELTHVTYTNGVAGKVETAKFVVTGKAEPPEITDVVATPSEPWDGRVSISFNVVNSPAAACPDWNQPYLSIVATDNTTGSNYVSAVSALSARAPYQLDDALYGSKGEHAVTWDMYGQGIRFASSNVTFTVAYVTPFDVPGEYCIIDLSGGKDASSYPVTYVSNVPNVPAACYNGMIAPLFPMAVRGAIWYQGCSNVGRHEQYKTLLPAVIGEWREGFTTPDGWLPFYIVQLAAYLQTRGLQRGRHFEDGDTIRRSAAENNVTIFTSLDTVRVLLDVLEETTITVSTIDA